MGQVGCSGREGGEGHGQAQIRSLQPGDASLPATEQRITCKDLSSRYWKMTKAKRGTEDTEVVTTGAALHLGVGAGKR